jgi:lysozyme
LRPHAVLALTACATLLAAAGGWYWSQTAIGPHIEGVDVSNHQGAIDWRALAADDVHFVYIKASEGGDFVDQRFAENWQAALAAGLYVGGYHFFTLCRSGVDQARHFAAVLPDDGPRVMPPAVDLEHMGPCRKGPTIENVEAEVQAFLAAMEQFYGARPILYTTREFHDAHITALRGERYWLRSLFRKPDFRENDWIIWQHHNRGSKRGVPGPIDLNSFRGDARALAAFAANPNARSPQQGPQPQ